jgi:hypothetical protein
MGSAMTFDLLHPDVLDADLLAQEHCLAAEPLGFRVKAGPRVKSVSGPAERSSSREIGDGEGMDHRRAGLAGPPEMRRNRMEKSRTGAGRPPGEFQA